MTLLLLFNQPASDGALAGSAAGVVSVVGVMRVQARWLVRLLELHHKQAL